MGVYKYDRHRKSSRRKRSGMPRLSTVAVAAAIGFFAANQGPEIVTRASEAIAWPSPSSAAVARQPFTAQSLDITPSPSIISIGEPSSTASEPRRGGPGTISGRVERIADGDTFSVSGQRIRICGIDAPEKNTAAGRRAREEMTRLVSGRSVSCKIVGHGTPCDGRSSDRSYDRVVAQCHIGGRDIAAEMVRRGHAEDWKQYSGGYYSR
ncbi:MAG: thermonuclease family protein [Aliihoeflea sp.]|uniref:thermonuclease family protein n=1 Tax=Aliihoeflea sp. TaxID=2608088 RepID=UPI00403475E7